MTPHQRWNTLLEIVSRDGTVEVETVARELAVSTATIRRDLDQLAQQQMVIRTRGGAKATTVAYDLPLRYKTARNATEKQRIAKAAAGLINAGSVVGLNGGTTTTEVARALATRPDLNSSYRDGDPTLTVVTNALNIANELIVRRQVKVVVTGGVARPQSYELIGPLATQLLDQLAIDQLCLGVNGLHPATGPTAYHEGEAGVNNLMVRRARQVIVVADSTKLGKITFARVCPIGDVDIAVTDSAADPRVVAELTDAGVQVITA